MEKETPIEPTAIPEEYSQPESERKETMSIREDMNAVGHGGGYGNDSAALIALMALTNRRDDCNNHNDRDATNTILSDLGDIKGAVPLAEAQVQLALAGSTGEIRSHLGQVENSLVSGQAMINKNVSDAIAASLASQNNINLNVLQTGTTNLIAIKDAQNALGATITADGEKTRALITSNQISELQRLAAERQDEIIELRHEHHRGNDRHGMEINMINNQNQNQLQFQQQAQVLTGLTHALMDVSQVAKATNQSLIIGNTGAVAGPNQNANPTNVRA